MHCSEDVAPPSPQVQPAAVPSEQATVSQTILFPQEDLLETTKLPPTYLNIFAVVSCHSIPVLSLLAVPIQSPLSAAMFL